MDIGHIVLASLCVFFVILWLKSSDRARRMNASLFVVAQGLANDHPDLAMQCQAIVEVLLAVPWHVAVRALHVPQNELEIGRGWDLVLQWIQEHQGDDPTAKRLVQRMEELDRAAETEMKNRR